MKHLMVRLDMAYNVLHHTVSENIQPQCVGNNIIALHQYLTSKSGRDHKSLQVAIMVKYICKFNFHT